jgi:hypothetical protein
MMKLHTLVIIVALALASAASAEQAKPRDKGKPPATKDQAPGPSSAAQCSPDTGAPVIASVSATPNSLGAPNHKMTSVAIAARVTDNCPGATTWSVTGISSNEPLNGTGDGDSEPDWSIAGAHAVSLRAERAGSGTGRIYTVTITAKDAAGNTSTATTAVSVPHNK